MGADIQKLQVAVRRFAEEREWQQFHTPKNLATSIAIEAAELLEHFQWLTDAQSAEPPEEHREEIGNEIADVLIYLLRLCDRLGIDPVEAAWRKLDINAKKYPADLARGSIRKYTEL